MNTTKRTSKRSARVFSSAPTGDMPRRVNGKPCMWLAWTGDNPLPGYLELCLESVQRYNSDTFEVIVLTPDVIPSYLPDIHPAYEYLSYVHRADYLRLEILHNFGGMYVDMDTICFRNLLPFYHMLEKVDLVGYDGTPWNEIFGVGVIGPARSHSRITGLWSRVLRKHLDRKFLALKAFRKTETDPQKDCLAWTEIMSQLIQPITRTLHSKKQLSLHITNPGVFQTACTMFTNEQLMSDGQLSLAENVSLLILNNAEYPDVFKMLTQKEVLASQCGLATLISKSFV